MESGRKQTPISRSRRIILYFLLNIVILLLIYDNNSLQWLLSLVKEAGFTDNHLMIFFSTPFAMVKFRLLHTMLKWLSVQLALLSHFLWVALVSSKFVFQLLL